MKKLKLKHHVNMYISKLSLICYRAACAVQAKREGKERREEDKGIEFVKEDRKERVLEVNIRCPLPSAPLFSRHMKALRI